MWMDNQCALVTGAARGVGLAIARRFLTEGARVVMADRDEAALHAAIEGLGAGRDRAIAVTADVSRPADARRLVKVAVEWWIATDSNLPNDEDRAWLGANTSLGRAGRPEEIAGVVAFLAGPDASFISGQAIIADGGEV